MKHELKQIGPRIRADIAQMLKEQCASQRVSASLTSCNVLQNGMDVAAAGSLVAAVKDRDISLCGIQPDRTSANFCNMWLKSGDAVLLASDLSKAGVSGSLTQVLAFFPHFFCTCTIQAPTD